MKDRGVISIIKESFTVFVNNFLAYVLGTIISIVGSMLIITAPPLAFGLYCMGLKGARGEKVEFKDVFKGFSFFLKSWIFAILISVLVSVPIGIVLVVMSAMESIIGIIALFCFGILWGGIATVALMYTIPVIVSKDIGVIEGITSSINLVKKNPIKSILLFIATCALSILLCIIPIVPQALASIILSKATTELEK